MLQVRYMTISLIILAIVMALTLFIVYSTPVGSSIRNGVEGSLDSFSLSWIEKRGLIDDVEEDTKDAELEPRD